MEETKKNNITIAQELIGKPLKDWTIDECATLTKSENSEILKDPAFLAELLKESDDEDIRQAYYHLLVARYFSDGLSLISTLADRYAAAWNVDLQHLTAELIKSKNDKNRQQFMIDLSTLKGRELNSENCYTKIMAYIQLALLFDADLSEAEEDIKNTLKLIYSEMNKGNMLLAYPICLRIFGTIVKPIDDYWIHKFDKSIVDTDDENYQTVVKNIALVNDELTNKSGYSSSTVIS